MVRKMIIDTDTASDDAVAIMMALVHPDIDVLLITTVAGNVALPQASINARYTVELCGHNTPVYEGAEKPLQREAYSSDFFHGEDGMGNMHYPAPTQAAAKGHAVDALIEGIRANPGVILVTLGPMTNIALAVQKAPDIADHVSRCVVMGGVACTVGNITPAAEYNIWCDPEAARICFHSGLPIEMVGWELCRGEANLVAAEIDHLKKSIATPLAHFAMDCNRVGFQVNCDWLGEPGLALPDPVAMAVAIDPSICTKKSQHYVDVECAGELTRGMTVVDQLNITATGDDHVSMWRPLVERGEPNVTVCWTLDAARWKALLESSVT